MDFKNESLLRFTFILFLSLILWLTNIKLNVLPFFLILTIGFLFQNHLYNKRDYFKEHITNTNYLKTLFQKMDYKQYMVQFEFCITVVATCLSFWSFFKCISIVCSCIYILRIFIQIKDYFNFKKYVCEKTKGESDV